MFKLEDVEKLKNKLSGLQKEPEVISREDFIRAKTNVSIMTLETTEDAFLYFASLNLLNTYVKQNKKAISYGFKQEVISGFDAVINNGISGVTYNYDKKEGVLVVNVAGMQFSFHQVLPSAKMDYVKNFEFNLDQKYYSEKSWDGLRLQPVAKTVFEFASGLDGLSKETFAGDLKECQDAQVKADRERIESALAESSSKAQ